MSYPHQDYYITFLFQGLEAFEALPNANHLQCPGRPKVYPNRSLIVPPTGIGSGTPSHRNRERPLIFTCRVDH